MVRINRAYRFQSAKRQIGICGDAPTGNASLRPGGNLSILWARPVRFCGGGLFYITYAVPVEGPKGCGLSTRSP